jgi:hypothetical protein
LIRINDCHPFKVEPIALKTSEMVMTANIGVLDRTLRIVAGLVLIAFALGLFGSAYQTVWGWIGIIPLATGVVSWCPLYTLLGMNTCAR